MRKKSLGVNAFLNSLRSLLNIIFPLITFPYISRVLNVVGIGKYNFSNSIVSYFQLIGTLGISTYAIREGTKYRNNERQISRFSSEVFTINVVSTILAYILLFISLIIFNNLRSYTACILILSLQIFLTTIGTEWIYQIFEDYTYITIRSIIFQIISLILLFVFIKSENDYLKYAAITVFSAAGSNIFNFMYARRFCRINLVFKFDWKKHLVPILIIWAVSISTTIYSSSDLTILGIMKNNYSVGLYSVSSKIYQIAKTLLASIVIVTVPRLSLLFGQKKIKEYNDILVRLTNTLIMLTLPTTTGVIMLSREIIMIVSGSHYMRATSSLSILSASYVFSLLAWILMDCVLYPAKREKLVLRSTIVSAILNFVLNLIFIPQFSENAAAVSTVIAEICMTCLNFYFARDIVKNVLFSREILINIRDSIVGCMGIIFICWLCNIGMTSMWVKTIFSIILSVAIYGAILILLNNKLAMEYLHKFRDFRLRK